MTDVSKEYASALFSLARESKTEPEIYGDLMTVDKLLYENPDYIALLASHGIPKDERLELAGKATEGLNEYVSSFVCLLTEHGHIESVHRCISEFEALYKEAQKQSTAYVTTAFELTEEQTARLKAKLEKISGHEVTLACTVDKEILGGVIVNMDDTVIDGSIKRKLKNLKEVID